MADTKSSAKASTPGAASQSEASPSLGQRIAGFFRAPGASGGQGGQRPASNTTRFIIGSVIFILVAEVLTYLIQYANIQFKLNLNQPIAGANASWLTWFFLINVALILGLWILLNRLGFFPRDMWTSTRTSSTARGASSSGSGNGNKKNDVNQIPGIGKSRTRAERRMLATANAAKATNGKGRASSDTRAAADDADFSTEHDEAYDRAKAAQRQRKRRALR